jgi:DNA invertase Pin-like site-specific DNA recombinase
LTEINLHIAAIAPTKKETFNRQMPERHGLASARARGRLEGRPPIDLEEAKVRAARKLHDDRTLTIDDICKTLNISRSTYYRYVPMKKRK